MISKNLIKITVINVNNIPFILDMRARVSWKPPPPVIKNAHN